MNENQVKLNSRGWMSDSWYKLCVSLICFCPSVFRCSGVFPRSINWWTQRRHEDISQLVTRCWIHRWEGARSWVCSRLKTLSFRLKSPWAPMHKNSMHWKKSKKPSFSLKYPWLHVERWTKNPLNLLKRRCTFNLRQRGKTALKKLNVPQ